MALIDLKNIFKKYQMGTTTINALNGLECSIEKGEYVALMGPSGSGKSTLMNVIGCLDSPTSGIYLLHPEQCLLDSCFLHLQIHLPQLAHLILLFDL